MKNFTLILFSLVVLLLASCSAGTSLHYKKNDGFGYNSVNNNQVAVISAEQQMN